MHEHQQQLIAAGVGGIGAEIPEVGVERQIAGGAHEGHEHTGRIAHAQQPGAALEGPLQPLGRPGRIAAGHEQPIELIGGGPNVGLKAVPLG